MARQLLTLGGANFVPFSGFAVPISTNYTPNNTDLTSNLTGAITPVSGTDRPLAVSSLTIYFRSGGGTGTFFCSNNSEGTGSVTSTSSSIGSFNGTVSRVLSYPALISQQLFYGFDKTNTTTTNYSSDTRSGSDIFSDGSEIFSDRAIFAQLQVDTIPSAVQSLSATAASSTQINVSWSAPSDNGGTSVTGYRVAYKPTASSTWSFETTASTSIALTGLVASTTYNIKVGAQNSVTTLHNSTYSYTGVQEHTGTASDTTATTPAGLPVFTDSTIASPATVGVAYSDGVSATNTVSYSISAGSLPPGFSLSTNTGAITASNPTTAGTYNFTVSANNASGSTTLPLSLTVNPATPVWIDQTIASPAFVDSPYSDGVSASNSAEYQISSGSLPTGITLNTSSGAITGTPTVVGVSNFTIQAYNVTGTISVGLTLEVDDGLAPPSFTDSTLSTDLRRGISYSDGVTANNSPSYTTVGTFVPGLTLGTADGTVTGTPTNQGTYNFDIVASNAAGSATASFSLPVKPGAQRWDGSAWVRVETYKRWDGSAWVDVTQSRRWDGSAWVAADL